MILGIWDVHRPRCPQEPGVSVGAGACASPHRSPHRAARHGNQLFRQMCAESAVWEGPWGGLGVPGECGLRGQGCVMRAHLRRAWVHARVCVCD